MKHRVLIGLGEISGDNDLLAHAYRDLAYAYSLAGYLERAERFADEAIQHIHRSTYRTFSPEVWGRFNAFLRTRSRNIPSERTVKDVVGQMVLEDFLNVAPSATMQEIRDRFLADQKAVQDSRLCTEKEVA
jgi:hypothetical protein